MTTQLFISWSGQLSQKIASLLHDWIPSVLQSVEPFLSSTDIAKGSRWSDHIAKKLEECGFGIIVLTPQNLSAPWILFEAGALSKMVGISHVAPLLIGVDVVDVKLPLSQFQNVLLNADDLLRLVMTINKASPSPISEVVLERSFKALIPDFMESAKRVVADNPEVNESQTAETPRSELESLKLSVGELSQIIQSLREENRRNGVFFDERVTDRIISEIRNNQSQNYSRFSHRAIVELRRIYKAFLESIVNLPEDISDIISPNIKTMGEIIAYIEEFSDKRV